jgi:hypothetical protein
LSSKGISVRIIFVNRYFHPDSLRSSQLLADLAFDLAAQKHDVTVVTSRRRHDDTSATLQARESMLDVGDLPGCPVSPAMSWRSTVPSTRRSPSS